MTTACETKRNENAKRLDAMLKRRGFKVGRWGWLDRGTLRVAIHEDTVGIYRFVDKVGCTLAWEVSFDLFNTPYAVIEAAIKAAMAE